MRREALTSAITQFATSWRRRKNEEGKKAALWRRMMRAKKYVSGKWVSKRDKHLIKEAGGRYARQMSHKAPLSVGFDLAQAKKRLSKPAKRTAKEIRWALGIVGIGEGPKDLSENMRVYLRREK